MYYTTVFVTPLLECSPFPDKNNFEQTGFHQKGEVILHFFLQIQIKT